VRRRILHAGNPAEGIETMKKSALLLVLVGAVVCIAAASSKISDDSYRLVRELFAYKNREIAELNSMTQYMLDCQNAPDEQASAKKCTDRFAVIQSEEHALEVKHDVLADQLAAHIRQHRDEEWIFLGLLADDKEFSNLPIAH
jgi:hypothetical protein